MKERTFIISVALISLLALATVFLYADSLIHGSLTDGYTLLHFNNETAPGVQDQAADVNTARFGVTVVNHEDTAIVYAVEFTLDDLIISRVEKNIPASGKEIFTPSQEEVEKLLQPADKDRLYKVKLSWNQGEEVIFKRLKANKSPL